MAGEKRLRSFVHVHRDIGDSVVYGPGDEADIPAEDLAKIGDHCFLSDEEEQADKPVGVSVDAAQDDDSGEKPKRSSRAKQ